MEKLFIEASRKGYRFHSPKGLLTVEDLWNMPINGSTNSINAVGRIIKGQLKDSEEDEFSSTPSKENTVENNKLEIVRYIIKIKTEEKIAAATQADNKRYKDKLLGILADKQNTKLLDKSEEEILKELEALG